MTVNHVVNRLVDFCYGKNTALPHYPDEGIVADTRARAVTAVAHWIAAQDHIERPAAGKRSRWASIADLKVHAAHSGPSITKEEIDLAVEAALEGTDIAELPKAMATPISLLHL